MQAFRMGVEMKKSKVPLSQPESTLGRLSSNQNIDFERKGDWRPKVFSILLSSLQALEEIEDAEICPEEFAAPYDLLCAVKSKELLIVKTAISMMMNKRRQKILLSVLQEACAEHDAEQEQKAAFSEPPF